MYQFDRIKLVIWDLDDTLWKGTISEEDVVIPAMHRQLLQRLTDIGVVNSICSKNDWEPVQKELDKEGMGICPNGRFVYFSRAGGGEQGREQGTC